MIKVNVIWLFFYEKFLVQITPFLKASLYHRIVHFLLPKKRHRGIPALD
jgi:hypothetical protein